ncbi:hypothetical protein [Pacificibacter sp. AS14]|uniref:hypothetical protein n=1 Tax=Pacificibacter sp. AS14 TaxID=3135785 RepID=UPI00317A02C0
MQRAAHERSDHDLGVLADQLQNTARPQIAAMMGQIEAMMAEAHSLEEFRAMMLAGFGNINTSGFEAMMYVVPACLHRKRR